MSEVWLVVGLGNPGPAYAGHRHNVGYLVVDELVRRQGSPLRAHKSGRAEVLEGRFAPPGVEGPRVVLVRPRTYMNELGGPVKALAGFYGVPPGADRRHPRRARHPVRDDAGQARRRRQRAQRAALDALLARHRRLLPGPGRRRPAAGPAGPGRLPALQLLGAPSARCCRSRSTGPRTPSSRW